MQETTFWTIPLIVHLLLAVTLLGAITHQAVAVLAPAQKAAGDFVTRFRAVPPISYATAVVALFLATALLGSWIYVKYRVYVRIPMEQFGSWKIVAAFDGKEHVIAIGAALLPAYWY